MKLAFLSASQSAEIDRLVGYSPIFFVSVVLSNNPPFNNKFKKENLTEIWKVKLFSYWNQYYQSHSKTSIKATKIFFEKKERNGVQMKSQTNDTRNRYAGCMRLKRTSDFLITWKSNFVTYESQYLKWNSCKTELRNFIVTLNPSFKQSSMDGKNLT